MHQITVDMQRCRGTYLCKECEIVLPGLVQACERDGRVLANDWAMTDNSASISGLARCCPTRAIMIMPVAGDHKTQNEVR